MQQDGFRFVDRTGFTAEPIHPISPVVVPRAAIEAEVERLANLPAPSNGRRVSQIVNPLTGIGDGLAAGIAVSLCVLKPGERTRPIRHNSSLVNFCIRGGGQTSISGKTIRYDQYDVWTTPPWSVYEYSNDTNDLQARLTYSNSALLEKMQIHIVEENPPVEDAVKEPAEKDPQSQSPFGTFQLTDDGAYLMPYEKLISPDIVVHKPLHFPWTKVKQELDKLSALGKSYAGRRLYLLYNPATGHTNGTTSNFFAAITIRPKNIVDRPHRHAAAAINYFYAGKGFSIVDGKRYTWKSGDLMLTAPGWAVHSHASLDEDVYELTIQDSPLNIWMGSLLWQESLDRPVEALGLSGGFKTNRVA